jgi:membrane protease YdiL (CAAX protease family)
LVVACHADRPVRAIARFGHDPHMGDRSKPTARGAVAPAWIPVGLVIAAAVVPVLRVPALIAVAAVTIVALARRPSRPPAGAWLAWICLLPVTVGLAVGLVPDPAVANPGACDDLLVAPVVRRVVQASLVLGTVALLATRMGGRRSLGIMLPPDRRVTLLAAMTPVLVPIFFVTGPLLAGPFFGEVRLGLPSPVALLPAVILAVANSALEETAYRGAVQHWGAGALGRGGAIMAQALVFGSAHQGADVIAGAPVILVGVVAGGLIAGIVADRTRSLLLPFAAHAALDVPLALALTCRLA